VRSCAFPKAERSTEPTLYVDEKKGSDETGKGTQDAPFATPVGAYLSLAPSTASDKDP
jgi:asparaginyl-tRNA synthetase